MNKNLQMAENILEQLIRQGAEEVCLCAGARNVPVVASLKKYPQLKVYSFFDERSAGFFALGRARATGKPVIVTCTSGTAAAELLPATIESFYSKIPLVVLTADRPKNFRGTGSPQTIDQISFFKHHVCEQWDFELEVQEINVSQGPIHVNLCFSEPLVGKSPSLTPEAKASSSLEELKQMQKPLVIVGDLEGEEKSVVEKFLGDSQLFFVSEAHSNCYFQGSLPIGLVTKEFFAEYFDCVIRIGRVPTLRLWRDLDGALSDVPVFSFSHFSWTGLSRINKAPFNVTKLNGLRFHRNDLEGIRKLAASYSKKLDSLLEKYPRSEQSFFYSFYSGLPSGSQVFLGNSLPIREWDLVKGDRSDVTVHTQRGVNGIDGLASTFLGMCIPGKKNVLVLGDLSALYDVTAFWVLDQLPRDLDIDVIVINNSGGRIFRNLFSEPLLEMEHSLNFSGIAQQWGLEYQTLGNGGWRDFHWSTPGQRLIEVVPELNQSDSVWESLKL